MTSLTNYHKSITSEIISTNKRVRDLVTHWGEEGRYKEVVLYYNGILLTDYTLERQGFNLKQSEDFYSAHKPEMFAIGLGFMFLLLIPVIGWFIAPTYGLVASYLQFQKNKIS